MATRTPWRAAAVHSAGASYETEYPATVSETGVPGRWKALLTTPVADGGRPVARVAWLTAVSVGDAIRSRRTARPCPAIAASPSGSAARPVPIHCQASSAPRPSYETITTRSAWACGGLASSRHEGAEHSPASTRIASSGTLRILIMRGMLHHKVFPP